MANDEKNLHLEDALQRLESIVAALEGGKVSLEESLGMYEEGVELLRSCTRHIEEGRARVEILSRRGEEMIPDAYEEDDDEI